MFVGSYSGTLGFLNVYRMSRPRPDDDNLVPEEAEERQGVAAAVEAVATAKPARPVMDENGLGATHGYGIYLA